MNEQFQPMYKIFYSKACADIKIALLALERADPEIDDATILFHFQQAAEKLLKSILSYNNIHLIFISKKFMIWLFLLVCVKRIMYICRNIRRNFLRLTPLQSWVGMAQLPRGKYSLSHWFL